MPMPKEIGHQVKFSNSLLGLFKRGCWEIPEVMGASFMAVIGIGFAAAGLYNYAKTNGDVREYRLVYVIVRPEDPRACQIKNPVRTKC